MGNQTSRSTRGLTPANVALVITIAIGAAAQFDNPVTQWFGRLLADRDGDDRYFYVSLAACEAESGARACVPRTMSQGWTVFVPAANLAAWERRAAD